MSPQHLINLIGHRLGHIIQHTVVTPNNAEVKRVVEILIRDLQHFNSTFEQGVIVDPDNVEDDTL